jgi:anion-transporting  ArsA/GET3 family ATPase
VAPALPELSILGKITSGPPRFVGPKLDYDCLVVDAYATGHFLALLRAPSGMAEAVRFGPMGEQCRAIKQVICDPKICNYWVVSIAEELPVTEALELSAGIEKIVGLKPKQILNRWLSFDSNKTEGSVDFLNYLQRIEKQQVSAISELTGYPVKKLPQVFEVDAWKVVEALSNQLGAQQ